MSSNAFARLAAMLMADEEAAASLALLSDAGALTAQLLAIARCHGIDGLDAASLQTVGHDPLGLSRWTTPAIATTSLPPRHWLPVQLHGNLQGGAIDWAWFGPQPLSEPFFEDSIRRRLNLPFTRLFRCRTPLAALAAPDPPPADWLPPSGFIFHMSRCGSTLVAQMLAAMPRLIVVSEAAPIDAALQFAAGSARPDAVTLLRAMIGVFGRRRAGDERGYVVKLDSWHALSLPLLRDAFPGVPWIFLYRDPIEVLVSQMRQRGTQMLPQLLSPRLYGIDADEAVPDEDYCARVLAAICNAAATAPGGCFINYRDLPQAVGRTIAPHFGLTVDEPERRALQAASTRDAKAPAQVFVPDSAVKQTEAGAAVRQAVERHLAAVYRQLEARRTV